MHMCSLGDPVTASFTCPLSRATGCPDLRSDNILPVSVRLFLDGINTETRGLHWGRREISDPGSGFAPSGTRTGGVRETQGQQEEGNDNRRTETKQRREEPRGGVNETKSWPSGKVGSAGKPQVSRTEREERRGGREQGPGTRVGHHCGGTP